MVPTAQEDGRVRNGDNEAALFKAVEEYMSQPLPGTNRTEEYNRQRLRARLEEETDPANGRIVDRVLGASRPPGRVLEIGSGTGGLATALARRGYDVVGMEPEACGVRASERRAARYPEAKMEFAIGYVEDMPFQEESFDIVVSTQVLEHVRDIDRALEECFRVLRPGGVSIHLMPNYAYPFEPHYRVFWPPRASRDLGRLYLRLRGRDTQLFDSCIFPTLPAKVVSRFKKTGYVGVHNRYAVEVKQKFEGANIRTPLLRRGVELARRTRLLPLLRNIVLGLELYPSITIMAWKPPMPEASRAAYPEGLG